MFADRKMLAFIFPFSVRNELRSLRKTQFLSDVEVQTLQMQRLERLLHHAYHNVPYYREVFETVGLFTKNSINIDKFSEIPFLTKEILRSRFDELQSKDLNKRKWYFNTSGGSTGEPARFVQDAEYKAWVRAGKLLFDEWTGYRVGMPKVVLWGSERDLFVGHETLAVKLKRWLKNEIWLNSFRMTESQMRDYVQAINNHKPVQILAYVESIYELARFIEREGLKVHSPKAIMTSAGTLYPYMREVIERVFQAPVFNRYGSREVGDIACECQAHKGLHVSPLTHYVEIIHDDGTSAAPGEVGEVVVTSLVNYAMPLIRYRIGDMAVWAEEKCSCGCVWPILRKVVGRVTDTFVTASGTRVHGEYFTHLLYFKDWVRKFQFIQEDYNSIRLIVVPTITYEEARRRIEMERPNLESKIRLVMGPDCQLRIEIVDDISPSPSGKYRYTISKVVVQK